MRVATAFQRGGSEYLHGISYMIFRYIECSYFYIPFGISHMIAVIIAQPQENVKSFLILFSEFFSEVKIKKQKRDQTHFFINTSDPYFLFIIIIIVVCVIIGTALYREHNGYLCTLALFTFQRYFSAVTSHDMLYDRKSKTCSACTF